MTTNHNQNIVLYGTDKADIDNFIDMLKEKNCPFPRFIRRRMIKQLKKMSKGK